VHFERFEGVVRTRRIETTGGEVAGKELLIATNEGGESPNGR
jgi:hypothetical protein